MERTQKHLQITTHSRIKRRGQTYVEFLFSLPLFMMILLILVNSAPIMDLTSRCQNATWYVLRGTTIAKHNRQLSNSQIISNARSGMFFTGENVTISIGEKWQPSDYALSPLVVASWYVLLNHRTAQISATRSTQLPSSWVAIRRLFRAGGTGTTLTVETPPGHMVYNRLNP